MTSALEMQRARAAAIARSLVTASPAGSIACIFAGGSLGRGEVWAAAFAGQLEIYSDLDLYVVVPDPSHVAHVVAAARRISAEAPGIDGVLFLRAPDIGVYAPDDLRNQPVRPGTFDLRHHHILLHGDRALAMSLPAHDGARVPGEEALYLLENRTMELDDGGVRGDDAGGRMRRVAGLKARLDVDAAHQIVAGSFVATRQGRAEQFASNPPPTLDAAAREDVAAAYQAAGDLSSWLQTGDPARELDAVQRALSRAWVAIAPRVTETAGAATTMEAVARRSRFGARGNNAREVFRLRRRTGTPAWRAIVAAPGLSDRSPLRTLRLDGLISRLHAEGMYDASSFASHRRYIDRLTRTFGFTGGSPEKRARDMHRMFS